MDRRRAGPARCATARNVTIDDKAEVIAGQLRESWGKADIIITTGGLGPTCDDNTREAVAAVLGQKLVFDPAIEQAIADRFAKFGRKLVVTENNRKQAFKFEHGAVLPNPNGTAPGLWVEQDGKVLVMLPGPPNEMQPMFTEQVLPRLIARGLLTSGEAYVQIRTAGVGESLLETKFQATFDRYAGLGIAYCAHLGQVDCRVSSPDHRYGREVLRKTHEDFLVGYCRGRGCQIKPLQLCLEFLRPSECVVPSSLQLCGDKPVVGIDCLVSSRCQACFIARLF